MLSALPETSPLPTGCKLSIDQMFSLSHRELLHCLRGGFAFLYSGTSAVAGGSSGPAGSGLVCFCTNWMLSLVVHSVCWKSQELSNGCGYSWHWQLELDVSLTATRWESEVLMAGMPRLSAVLKVGDSIHGQGCIQCVCAWETQSQRLSSLTSQHLPGSTPVWWVSDDATGATAHTGRLNTLSSRDLPTTLVSAEAAPVCW